jgi:hypothetical protein
MAISRNDLEELKRIATNTYDRDKAFMQRVLSGIAKMEAENATLRSQNETLKKQLAAANQAK